MRINQTQNRTTAHEPGNKLNDSVRAGFIMQGTTLKAWCRDNKIDNASAQYALKTARRSKKAAALRARIVAAAKVSA